MQGGLSVNYSDNYYHLSQRHPDVPRLTQQHYEAMALFNEIASSDALRMDSMLQPGDVQLLNNHTQLHTRAEFEDFPVSLLQAIQGFVCLVNVQILICITCFTRLSGSVLRPFADNDVTASCKTCLPSQCQGLTVSVLPLSSGSVCTWQGPSNRQQGCPWC